MAKKTETTIPAELPEEPSKEPEKGSPPVAGLTLEDLEKHKASIRAELEQARNADKADRDELREQLKEINEHIKAQKKAQAEQEESQGKTTTIVVPPSQLSQPTHQEDKPVNDSTQAPTRKKKMRWW